MTINPCRFLFVVLVMEVVLCNLVDCSSKRQEFKRPDVFHEFTWSSIQNDFASDTTGKVWES